MEALDAGADDYVTKPFGMNDLARVRATARRPGTAAEAIPSVQTPDFVLDFANDHGTRSEQKVRLSPPNGGSYRHLR